MPILRPIYEKLFAIDDTPARISIGFGLGIFCGVMPGMGPLIALFFAFVLRVNRASALVGSLLTNTWLSIPVFFVAVKVGSFMTGTSCEAIRQAWNGLIKNFEWAALLKLSAYKIIAPVMIGYVAVALAVSIPAYAAALIILKSRKYKTQRGL